MLESLGSTNVKKQVSEKEMFANLEKLIKEASGRIVIATFSSQVERIKQILDFANRNNKKVALDGFSMKMSVELAKELGYINPKKETLVSIDKISDYKDNKVIILVTGAQGEENAALSRIVNNDHRHIRIKKNDTIIFSSSVIPGNERTIQRLKDKLYRVCDNVIHSDIMDVHTSGHSNRNDIEEIIRQIKPTYFIPVYANHYFLKEGAKIAYGLGYNEKNVVVPDNGSIISVNNKGISVADKKVNTEYVFVDGSGVGDIGEIVLKDRQKLSDGGMFIIITAVDKKTGQIKNSPDIISRGFVYLRESKDLLSQTRKKVVKIINDANNNGGVVNWVNVKEEIKTKISQFLFSRTERRPIILVVLIEV
ncbi:ribonuclease J [Patescibacteria group bacterium]|nr:ribonuclease J [Patescibacteria group bacterium]